VHFAKEGFVPMSQGQAQVSAVIDPVEALGGFDALEKRGRGADGRAELDAIYGGVAGRTAARKTNRGDAA